MSEHRNRNEHIQIFLEPFIKREETYQVQYIIKMPHNWCFNPNIGHNQNNQQEVEVKNIYSARLRFLYKDTKIGSDLYLKARGRRRRERLMEGGTAEFFRMSV